MDNMPVEGLSFKPTLEWKEGLRKLEKKVRPQCRFCGKDCRALNNNGIIGPGYTEWDYACKSCGKVQ